MNTLATSRIAEIALFTSGIVIAFFHLFLRANATRMVISPISSGPASPTKQKRPKIRFFGPSDLEMNISGPLALQGGPRPDSRRGLIDVGPEKNRYDFDPEYFVGSEKPLSPGSMKSVGVDPSKWPLPPDPIQIPLATETKDSTTGHKRAKSSYSLFPTRAEDIPRLPATVYTPPKSNGNNRMSKLAMRRQARRSSLGDTKSVTDVNEGFNFLAKPPSLFSRHNRMQSTDSSATVQIGLRFSVAPATLAAAKCTNINREVNPSVPPLYRKDTESSGTSLGLPIQAPSANSSSVNTPFDDDPTTLVNFPEPPQRSVSPGKISGFPQSNGGYPESQRDKVLPPTPRSTLPGPPPALQPPLPPAAAMSGLRMNPISPASPASSAAASSPRSATNRSPTTRSPTARIPLGAGTMARSPPPNGWI